MAVYSLKITTLSPLHIGDGNELRQGFDFMVQGNKTYRLNENAVLEKKHDKLKPSPQGVYPLPGNLLVEQDYSNPEFFRYILPGIPRSRRADARLKTCTKDVYDRPYIPGSSLKGALRTALAWTGWQEVNPQLDRSAIGRNRFGAGQTLERRIFGDNPNHDLLRALQVSDCSGVQKPGGGLMIVNAQVLTMKSAGSPVELEAIVGDKTFTGSIHIDDFLFSQMAERELHFSNRQHWLNELMLRVQKRTQARLTELIPWFEKAQNGNRIVEFYRQLLSLKLDKNHALIQLGWGTGWDGTTFGSHLQKDPQLFEQIVRDFRMHRAQPGSPPRKPGDPFPRSKRAAMIVKEGVANPAAPLGWVLLEMEKV